MNLVVVDIGNTKTMLGLVQDGRIQKTWKMSTNKTMLADEYISMFNNFLSQTQTCWEKTPICFSSVVPHITEQVQKHSGHRHDVHFVTYKSPVDFSIHLETPQTLGADRITTTQAAVKKHGLPLIIVDAGTATTITTVNKKNEFIGGSISPGIGISSQALFNEASALPTIQLKVPEYAIGNNTNAAILSGICLGHAGMIEKMVERFENEIGEPCTVLATGGGMELLLPSLPKKYIPEPTLALEGLVSIYENVQTRGVA